MIESRVAPTLVAHAKAMRFCMFLIVFCCLFGCLSSSVDAQVTVEVRQLLTGVDDLKTIGNKTFVSAKSKPVVESVGYIDLGKIPEKPQVLKVFVTDAQRRPMAVEKLTNSQYVIRGEGRVWVDARVTDLPSQFILDETIEIELPKQTAPAPQPVNPDLQGLSSDARKAMVDFVQGMAKDIEAVNADIDAGKVRTVSESAAATIQRDIATRNKFKAEMGKLLEPRLGNAALPPTAKQTFSEIANGWRSVK